MSHPNPGSNGDSLGPNGELTRESPERYGLTLGSLPERYRHIQTAARLYRSTLETAVRKAFGTVTLTHAHAIQAAAECLTKQLKAEKYFREEEENLTLEQKMKLDTKTNEYAIKRFRCVRMLGLDGTAADDPLAKFYGGSLDGLPDTAGESERPDGVGGNGEMV